MMRINVKLMGTLKSRGTDAPLELPDGSTILDLLQQLQLPPESVQTCTVNGKFEHDRQRRLQDGDELTLLPPVGGG